MFSERKNVCKEPIRGSLRVQFPPAGDTVCNADRTPPKKKDHLMGGLSFLYFHYTIDEHVTAADFCNLFFRLVFTHNLVGRFNQVCHDLIELRGVF